MIGLEFLYSVQLNMILAVVYEPLDGPGGSGPIIKREKFHPDCVVVCDGIAKPDDTQMENIREKKTGKREREK